MFKVLITDDDYEDRELLKLEIKKALGEKESDLRFFEAVSIKEAKKLLDSQFFDLMTLDIQLDRLNEGIEALPDLFESYPTLNIIIISGLLNKSDVTTQLFKFTKDNVLKGKRWSRHFDVIDKKDDKSEALRLAYSFAIKEPEIAGKLRDLFLLAESYMEKGMLDKCMDVYKKIQQLTPDEYESNENISLFKIDMPVNDAFRSIKKENSMVSSLLLGHYLENKLREYTKIKMGRGFAKLYDCATELDKSGRLTAPEMEDFHELMKMRNRAIHNPSTLSKKHIEIPDKHLTALFRG
jgi:CheY-like chemotaxis protein